MNSVEEAFRSINRKDFVPDDYKSNSHIDAPLPIGFGQTNSQPTTVRLMLEWLEAEQGNKVLDVGSGSGWTTALLSKIVGPKGKVYAVEIIPELVDFGRENAQRAGVKNAKFFQASQTIGLPKFAPYDRILVSASARELPSDLIKQLKENGKMVIPVKNDILDITKISGHKVEIVKHPGFMFVPLV